MAASGKGIQTYKFFGLYRVLLSFLVILQHIGLLLPGGGTVYRYMTGTIAVDAFFSLSAIVIMEAVDVSYRHRPFGFLLNRVVRIAPQYILSVLLCALIQLCMMRFGILSPLGIIDPSAYSIGNIALNLFAFMPGIHPPFPFVYVVWSLRVEAMFYIIIATNIIALYRFPTVGYWPSIVIGVFLLLFHVTTGFFRFEIGKFVYVPFFLYGALCYKLFAKPGFILAILTILALIACIYVNQIIIIPTELSDISFDRREDASHIIMLFLLLVIPVMVIPLRKYFRSERVDQYLGNLSYPIYIHHIWVLLLVSAVLAPGLASACVSIGATTLVAVLSNRYVEDGLVGLRNRIRGRSI